MHEALGAALGSPADDEPPDPTLRMPLCSRSTGPPRGVSGRRSDAISIAAECPAPRQPSDPFRCERLTSSLRPIETRLGELIWPERDMRESARACARGRPIAL